MHSISRMVPPGARRSRRNELVGRAEATALHAEMVDVSDHQPVLVRIEEMMELDVGVRFEQRGCMTAAMLQCVLRAVGVVAEVAHHRQESLRKPGHVECGGEMGQCPVGRSDGHGGKASLRVLGRGPCRHGLGVDRAEAARRDALSGAAESEQPFPNGGRQQTGCPSQRLQRARLTEGRKVTAVQRSARRSHEARGRVEIRQKEGFARHVASLLSPKGNRSAQVRFRISSGSRPPLPERAEQNASGQRFLGRWSFLPPTSKAGWQRLPRCARRM